MKTNKQINLIMTVVAAVVLIALNVGVLMASKKGAIAPIDNIVLWGGFVALNVISIVWAIGLLGLQPLVVSLSYVVGGVLAFTGVRGMEGINVAEIATAGATYGAFGALAIGNSTVKVRLAFFNKGQVPFIFIIIGLLVLDAVLNSGISKADSSVFVNAVLFPFVLAGVVIGLVWSVLNRFGIGRKPTEVLAEAEAAEETAAALTADAVSSQKLVIEMPEEASVAAEADPIVPAEIKPEPTPVVEPAPEPVVAEEPVEKVAVETKKQDEEFFPLEIDKDDDFEMPDADSSLLEVASMMEDDDSFAISSFDADLYASGSLNDEQGGVMVEEPTVSVALDLDAEEHAAPAEEKAVAQEAEPESEQVAPVEEKQNGDDWLGGHLDLLSKLK